MTPRERSPFLQQVDHSGTGSAGDGRTIVEHGAQQPPVRTAIRLRARWQSGLKAFVAGFLSTLSFHQGMLAVLHGAGLVARVSYSMAPTYPLHAPAVISLAFWGGVWAVALSSVIGRRRAAWTYYGAWTVLGAVFPSLVALFVVLPLKGAPIAGGWSPETIATALLLNGVWGFGAALLLRGFEPGRR
jgi:hypothetical protein